MVISNHIAVAAIDFGTTFSGWALSFKHTHEKQPNNIFTRYIVTGCEFPTLKTPTAILIASDGKTVESFGYDAENEYFCLKEKGEHHNHYFFYRFKMMLDKQRSGISKFMELEADNGKCLPATTVFALAIRYFVDDILAFLKYNLTKDDIQWNLTVPAIWDEKTKQFMREAAIKAGISGYRLTITSEPEGVSSYCQYLPFRMSSGRILFPLDPGSSYITIDCGGGTTDIYCHEFLPDGKLKEILRANGLDVGGIDVDSAFEQFCIKLFGENIWQDLKKEHPSDFISIMRTFEAKQKYIKPKGSKSIAFALSSQFVSLVKSKYDQELRDVVLHAGFQDDIQISKSNQLTINAEFLMKDVYDKVTRRFRNHLSEICKHSRLQQAKTVFLIGGLSKSLVIQEVVRETLLDKRIIPMDAPDMAVVVGAVIHTHDDSIAQARTMALKEPVAIASIDFGTTFSGWAMSLKTNLDKNPYNVVPKNWNNGENISTKTPTSLLIQPDGETFEAFGYEAENRYAELIDEENHENYYYFRRFKMLLFNQKDISRHTMLEAINGRSLPAMLVFESAIRYLKDDLLAKEEKTLKGHLTVEDIHWALTIPAIWNEKAKKFMKEAAIRAGIHRLRLSLVLEPEAASVFCQSIPMEMSSGGHIGSMQPGSSYMVVDCGGGTIDICCHEILPDRKLKEIHKARGDALGGTNVDKAFEELLIKIFGDAAWKEFNKRSLDDYLCFFRTFEVKKRQIPRSGNKPIMFKVPPELLECLKSKTGRDIQQAVSDAGFQASIRIKRDKMQITSDFLIQEIYDNVVYRIRELLTTINSNQQVQKTSTVLLVGGLSESPVIQDCVRSVLPDKTLITTNEPELVVLKGAIVYRYTNFLIAERVSRYTYGYVSASEFSKKQHSKHQMKKRIDGAFIVHLFNPIVRAGESIDVDHTHTITDVLPQYDAQAKVALTLIAVDEKDDIPTYSDDQRCIQLGEITVPITDKTVPLAERKFDFVIKFGGTEIIASGTEKRTQRVTEGNIDFLG